MHTLILEEDFIEFGAFERLDCFGKLTVYFDNHPHIVGTLFNFFGEEGDLYFEEIVTKNS